MYFDRCDGTAATVEDFLACFAAASARDLAAFKHWYGQAGTPLVTARGVYDSAARTYSLTLAQATAPTRDQPVKSPVVMPISLGLVDPSGEQVVLASNDASAAEINRGVFELTSASRRIVFNNVAARPALSLFRGFSAPVRVDDDLTEADLLTLSRHDRDSFNRWQAVQTLATRVLMRGVDAVRNGGAPFADIGFTGAYGGILSDALAGRLDHAFAAFSANLPSEADLAREMAKDVDPDAIFASREGLRANLGRTHAEKLTELHERLFDSGPFSPDARGAGRRALRNLALVMLAAARVPTAAERAQKQFAEANNMTERLAALAVLTMIPDEAREKALEAFWRAHSNDALILDKWFVLQAQIPERETLDRVRALMAHPSFSLHNPNRTRSLIGGFTANQTQFNRADGAGYEFLGEVVLALDANNPQIAARLLSALRSWRSLEPGRQGRAEAMLRRIASQPRLSADLNDIVTRSLS
jgi:aminopeptidase N